jgi:hypothetical protein
MLHVTGIGIVDFLLTVLFIIIIAIVVVRVCQALGLTADALAIPPYGGLAQ